MSRPRRPHTLASYSDFDEQVAELIDDALKRNLDLSQKRFEVPMLYKTVSYAEFIAELRKTVISRDYFSALKDVFRSLPAEYNRLNKDLRSIFQQLLLKIEEAFTYIDELSEYVDTLESEFDELQNELQSLRVERDTFDERLRAAVAEAKLEAYNDKDRERQETDTEDEVVEAPKSTTKVVKRKY